MLFSTDKHRSTTVIVINNFFSTFSHFLKHEVNILAIPHQLFFLCQSRNGKTLYSNRCIHKSAQAEFGTIKNQTHFHFEILLLGSLFINFRLPNDHIQNAPIFPTI